MDTDADPEQVARAIALRRLATGPRTCAQLHAHLLARGVSEPIADRVVERFTEVGLLDDAQFARMWVESRHRTRGTARTVLRRELRERGIDDLTAAPALAQIDGEAELDRARQLVCARLARMASVPVERRERRLVGLLTRRGYSTGVACQVVRAVLADGDDGAEAP